MKHTALSLHFYYCSFASLTISKRVKSSLAQHACRCISLHCTGWTTAPPKQVLVDAGLSMADIEQIIAAAN